MTLFPHPDHTAGSRAIRQPGMAAAAVVAGILANRSNNVNRREKKT
jgi:hypothetical protein